MQRYWVHINWVLTSEHQSTEEGLSTQQSATSFEGFLKSSPQKGAAAVMFLPWKPIRCSIGPRSTKRTLHRYLSSTKGKSWVSCKGPDLSYPVIGFIESNLWKLLQMTGLATAMSAVRYGICQNPYPFYAILKKYNSKSCTFYTPVGELGLPLHEMYAVSGLS